MTKIKFGDHVRVIKIPEKCVPCSFCLGNRGYWSDKSPNGSTHRNGIFNFEKKVGGGICCGAIRPEHLAPICKLNRGDKNGRKS